MERALSLVYGIVVVVVVSVPASAQEVSRPVWSEGDTWTYRRVERMSGNTERR